MASGVFIGLAAPGLAEWAAPVLPYTVAAMMTIAAIRISAKDFADTLRRWHVVTSLVVWLLVVSPLVVLSVTWLIPTASADSDGFDHDCCLSAAHVDRWPCLDARV